MKENAPETEPLRGLNAVSAGVLETGRLVRHVYSISQCRQCTRLETVCSCLMFVLIILLYELNCSRVSVNVRVKTVFSFFRVLSMVSTTLQNTFSLTFP